MCSTSSSSAPDGPPLRLAVTNTSRSWGGTEQYALQLASGLAAAGHAVLLLWAHETVGERVRAAGLPHERLRLRGDADLLGLARLAGALRAHRADAVVLTKWREYLLGGLAARLAGVPLAVASLGLRVAPRGDLKRRLIFRLADRVVVNAEEIRDGLLACPWIDADRVRVVHNGLDLERFRPGGDGRAFRASLGIPAAAPLALAVGNLTPQKDHDLFARAAARVLARVPEAHFAVVGEGFLRPALEARVRELGLAGRFHLAGFAADVRPAYAAADLFVLSSDNEGMAWALLEALACGLPAVATDVSGTRACVRDGENGVVVPPRDEIALADAVAGLLADPVRRRRLAERAPEPIRERFAADRMVRDTLAVLREGLAARGAGRHGALVNHYNDGP